MQGTDRTAKKTKIAGTPGRGRAVAGTTATQRSAMDSVARQREAVARQRNEIDPVLRRLILAALDRLKTPGCVPSDVLAEAVTQAAAHGATVALAGKR